ncbi:hypothetical protein ACM01_15145 [Streptomyces viridochromogenes]|uniref:Uncharacterized protein n=1 Tax=Streptomyces viridochromogenes TaxID=1938 RepID=A0A0J7ZDT0_STRVR|nr:hypothetical protein [Streptomyces viridochromogenes]KMS74246.1 hypothetical protein ACM01_15145 [Streptomyces viridochromogenes]
MALIALVSAKSDGVTTAATALALASRRPVLLAELDMAGGSLRHGLLRDVPRGEHHERLDGNTGLHRLPQADWERASVEQDFTPQVAQHLWPMDDSDYRVALPGLIDPRQAASLTSTWPTLLNVLQLTDQQLGWDVLVDGGRLVLEGGRLHPVLTPAPVLREADLVLLVVRMTEESQALAYPMVRALQDDLAAQGAGARALGLLVLGEGYRPADVARGLEAPVLATLPWDETAAAYLRTGGRMPRGVTRSRLMRAARDTMGPLREHADRRRLHLQMRSVQAASPAVERIVQQLAQRGVRHG